MTYKNWKDAEEKWYYNTRMKLKELDIREYIKSSIDIAMIPIRVRLYESVVEFYYWSF